MSRLDILAIEVVIAFGLSPEDEVTQGVSVASHPRMMRVEPTVDYRQETGAPIYWRPNREADMVHLITDGLLPRVEQTWSDMARVASLLVPHVGPRELPINLEVRLDISAHDRVVVESIHGRIDEGDGQDRDLMLARWVFAARKSIEDRSVKERDPRTDLVALLSDPATLEPIGCAALRARFEFPL